MPANNEEIRAGELRHRIDIVKVSPVQDASGGWDVSRDKIFAKVWAKIETMGGSDSLVAGAQTSTVQHTITIRHIGAAPAWQPLFNYPVGALVKDTGGYLQQTQGAGTSGATVPTWNEVAGQSTNDGSPSTGVTWKNLGAAPARTGVTAAMQVIFQGRLFQITSVQNPLERNKKLILTCLELNDNQQQNAQEGNQ